MEPHGVYQGRAEIVRIAGEIRAMHPTFKYSPLAPAEVLHQHAGRVQWVAGNPGEAPAYAGTDFIVAKDGKITALYLFFDGALIPPARLLQPEYATGGSDR